MRARAKERSVDFSGAFFLQDPALPSAEKRRRIEDALLLALRCLMLALGVLALSGPRMKGWGFGVPLAEDLAREAVVIVLDDSPSAAQRSASDGTRVLDRSLLSAVETLACGRSRRIALEAASGRSLPWCEAARFPGRLKEFFSVPPARSGDRTRSLARAQARLREATEDRRILLLVSDLNRNFDERQEDALTARWAATCGDLERGPTPPVFMVGELSSSGRQWTLESIAPVLTAAGPESARAPVVGQPFGIRVRVRCHRGAGTRKLRVETAGAIADDLNGGPDFKATRDVLERSVALGEGEVEDVDVPVLCATPGAMSYRACLEGSEAYPYDDELQLVVCIEARRHVVLWDLRDTQDALPLRNDHARAALVAALDPLAGQETSRVRLSQPLTPRLEDLERSTMVIALFNPYKGSGIFSKHGLGFSERLRGLVQAGVKLLWIADLTGKPEEQHSASGGARIGDPLLPRNIERVEACLPDTSWRLGLSESTHPLLAPFAGGRNGDLAGVRFAQRLRLGVEPSSSHPAGAWETEQVLARFSDGLPALVLQRIGNGCVGQFAFGLERQGGLAASPVWPVLVQTFIEWASDDGLGAHPGPTVFAGQAESDPWRVSPRAASRRVTLSGPFSHGASTAEQRDQLTRWELEIPARATGLPLPTLERPELYRLTFPDSAPPRAQRWAICRTAACESELERLPEEVLEQLREVCLSSGGAWTQLDMADASASLEAAFEALRPGKPLASWMWLLFAAAMTVELGALIFRKRAS